INENQLKQLLSDLESDRVERTISTSKTDKFAEAVCAFANDFPNHSQPGYLLIGVDNNRYAKRTQGDGRYSQKSCSASF
ncbi:MAG: RNA-binding domain-containing protein, partial [Deltaproteobacteria bacterium]